MREYRKLFHGKPEKIRLVSNNFCYGPMPDPEDEIEQHITIIRDGRVWFTGYSVKDGQKLQKLRSRIFRIVPSSAERVLRCIASYFEKSHDLIGAKDAGTWNLRIINDGGDTFDFSDSLQTHICVDGTDCSALLRKALGMWELLAFDGENDMDAGEWNQTKIYRLFIADGAEFCDSAKYEFVADFAEKQRAWEYAKYMIGRERYAGKSIIMKTVSASDVKAADGSVECVLLASGEMPFLDEYTFR